MNTKIIFFLSRVDVAANVAWTKLRRHVAVYENVMCHTLVHVRPCARVCACARVINENKRIFSRFSLSH